jgi:hypothetical protein
VITLKAMGEDGTTGFSHSVSLDQMQAGIKSMDRALILCPEPRPQICTREYRPVCATMNDGTKKTYSNGCTSCTDLAVVEYEEGACP